MGSLVISNEDREGAEIIYGAEECYSHSVKMLEAVGFPKGVLPLRNLEECGWVQATGFVWMKQKEPYEHFFTGTNTRVRYDRVVTAYVETKKMKKMTGVRSKQVLLWVPITEMSITDADAAKIYFKSAVGIGRSFPVSAFVDEEEEKKKLDVDVACAIQRVPRGSRGRRESSVNREEDADASGCERRRTAMRSEKTRKSSLSLPFKERGLKQEEEKKRKRKANSSHHQADHRRSMSFPQLGMAHHHEKKEKAGAPPRGCMAVRVGPEGQEQQRLLVPVAHLSHPLFAELLDEAAAEYGFSQAGPIAIPCGIEHFRRVQDAIDHEIGGGAGNHHHHHHHHHHLPHFAGCFGA
ncbi:hypothetical protein B296_00007510 [Ensete ventricosum]|uniref:Uncharacterized protein n=1 Tax=Ensete ventricosum TaxID=4639 RepID=A0A426YWW9_ENSVE|nr:hypothetical protein B296_00007510 [Ensete ventricosum]